MDHKHPDAMQRVCEEVEPTVWSLDRKFFREHPNRSYRIRQPLNIEIVENELLEGRPAECPPGTMFYIMVRQFALACARGWFSLRRREPRKSHQRNSVSNCTGGCAAAIRTLGNST